MIEGSGTSSFRENCTVCNKRTGEYVTYLKSGIEIKIYACPGECCKKVNLSKHASLAIKLIKVAIN